MESKTQKALKLVDAGMSVTSAANKVGVSPNAVYLARKRREGKPVCPCCNQVIREGFKTVDNNSSRDNIAPPA